MTENEFILEDRLGVIRDTITKYGEDNFYLSFSGGKDSTVVHHLLDMAVPGNKIPRVFCDTGIEYNAIRDFVKGINDDRIIIIRPNKNIREMLQSKGYPFKSKEHSLKLHEWQVGNRNTESIKRYLRTDDPRFSCPKRLRYQFTDEFKLKVSHFCCIELKKKPFKKWSKENNRPITITGMMKEEGGQRTSLDCIRFSNGKIAKFHPLAIVTHDWESWFIKEYNIRLCELYYPPFNFIRTGCKGCPFSLDLANQLKTMSECGLEREREQCENIWSPVYAEYRRIGYRLDPDEQIKLF